MLQLTFICVSNFGFILQGEGGLYPTPRISLSVGLVVVQKRGTESAVSPMPKSLKVKLETEIKLKVGAQKA